MVGTPPRMRGERLVVVTIPVMCAGRIALRHARAWPAGHTHAKIKRMYQPVPSWEETKAAQRRPLNSQPIPRRYTKARTRIEVIARLKWGHDEWQEVPGTADAWTRKVVLVYIDDPRLVIRGVWLPAGDVRRA